MSTAVQENVFASPWKKSDVVLVVEDTEFHVHRSILSMQSPMFEAMLNGHFKEASQEKIILEGKTSDDMLQFLKLLYPPNMIKKPFISLKGEGVLKMLALADEYQAEDVMNQCLEETKIIPENVLAILPYATKYHHESVSKKCFRVIERHIPTCKLDGELGGLDNDDVEKLLLAKCHHLESIAKQSKEAIVLLLKYLKEIRKRYENSFDGPVLRSCHAINISGFRQVRSCKSCIHRYRKEFIDKALCDQWKSELKTFSIHSMAHLQCTRDGHMLFDLLKNMDNVLE